MKKLKMQIGVVLIAVLWIYGCGYTTSSSLPPRLKTVYVQPFENKISYTSVSGGERNVYFPLLEVKIRDAVVDRFQFDGNLRLAEKENADLILEGTLVDYNRNPLRYTDNDDVQEYRVQIAVSLKLLDTKMGEPMWQYNRFIGEATYFVTGTQASSEESAVQKATEDLARRIVERTIENW